MDSSIPALVIGAILLLGATFLARSSITTYDRLGQQVKEIEVRAGDQARTRLTVVGASLDGAGDTLTVQVRNDGQTRVAGWPAVDVIVTYYTSPTARVTQWMEYADAAPAGNEWTVTAIAQDTFEPGILNPGETATLTVELSLAVSPASTNLILIAAENGFTVSAMFPG